MKRSFIFLVIMNYELYGSTICCVYMDMYYVKKNEHDPGYYHSDMVDSALVV